MNEAKAKLEQMLRDAPKRAVQFDDRLHVYLGVDTGKVAQAIKKALAEGKTVKENGVSQWIEAFPVFDPGKSGTERYTWKDGNTVRVERVLFTRSAKGEVTRKSLGFSWRDAASVL